MIILKNKGEIDIESITTMGINVKACESPIGFFGTGLKYAVAVFLREGVEFKLFIGANEYEFFTESKTIRDKEFDFCMMRGPYDSTPLGFTTELGKNWELWQAYREVRSNCHDEGGEIFNAKNIRGEAGSTTFGIDAVEFGNVFLMDLGLKLLYSDKRLEIYEGESDHIFYQGIRAKDLNQPSLYTYNIKEQSTLTEDRLLAYDWNVQEIINDCVAECDNEEIIKTIITAKSDCYESGLMMGYNNRVAPKETFNQVYLSNAKDAKDSARSYFTTHAPKPKLTPEQLATKVVNELREFCESHSLSVYISGGEAVVTGDIFQLLAIEG